MLLALPSAAIAQIVPVQMPNRVPMAPASQSNAGAHGITVNGSAMKKFPATRAQISLSFYSRTANIDTATMQPIVDALVKAGVARENVSLPASFGSPATLNNATVVAVVPNPTVAQMQAGIASVGAAIAGMSGISLGNAQVLLETDRCADVIDTVRAGAIKNARAKADETARELQVQVGPVLNVVANDQVGANGVCSSQYSVGQGNNGAITSPDDYVSVPVYAGVSITFAIKN
jgi:uncharacterized protein YggE